MESIAVDVVLLPETTVTDLAIEVNKRLLLQCPDKIVLGKDTSLPHISLAMGCIAREDVESISQVLRSIAAAKPIGKLPVAGVFVARNATGQSVSSIVLERTRTLRSLHEEIMAKLEPYVNYAVTAEMLVNPDEIRQSTLSWISTYRDNSSFDNFFPHITLGYGWLDEFPLPSEITPSKLALCRLGNHCTCRKILAEVELPVNA
jgi:2'-5' RNA ligase